MDGLSLFAHLFSIAASIVWIIMPFVLWDRMNTIRREAAANRQFIAQFVQELGRISDELSRIGGFGPSRPAASALPAIPPAAPPVASAPKAASPVTRKTTPISLPMTPGQKLSISRGGRGVGEFTLAEVRQMLHAKQLVLSDTYFDTGSQEWTTLDLNPYLY